MVHYQQQFGSTHRKARMFKGPPISRTAPAPSHVVHTPHTPTTPDLPFPASPVPLAPSCLSTSDPDGRRSREHEGTDGGNDQETEQQGQPDLEEAEDGYGGDHESHSSDSLSISTNSTIPVPAETRAPSSLASRRSSSSPFSPRLMGETDRHDRIGQHGSISYHTSPRVQVCHPRIPPTSTSNSIGSLVSSTPTVLSPTSPPSSCSTSLKFRGYNSCYPLTRRGSLSPSSNDDDDDADDDDDEDGVCQYIQIRFSDPDPDPDSPVFGPQPSVYPSKNTLSDDDGDDEASGSVVHVLHAHVARALPRLRARLSDPDPLTENEQYAFCHRSRRPDRGCMAARGPADSPLRLPVGEHGDYAIHRSTGSTCKALVKEMEDHGRERERGRDCKVGDCNGSGKKA